MFIKVICFYMDVINLKNFRLVFFKIRKLNLCKEYSHYNLPMYLLNVRVIIEFATYTVYSKKRILQD